MQTAIDIVLGKHLKTAVSSEQRKFVESELAKLVDKYSKLNTYNVHVASWNLGANRPLE
jgi:ribosome-associated translation inhibitor RaiA